MRLRIAAGVLALLSTPAMAAEDVRFVTCPIYRDTDAGRRTGCWLVDDPATGIRYEVNESESKPDWAHGVLIEGIVAKEQTGTCGGITLNPVRTSKLYDLDCPRHSLPAEGYSGRLPSIAMRYVAPIAVERTFEPPFGHRTFSPTFDFDDDFIIWNHTDYGVDQAIAYIKQVGAKRVRVTGWAATEPDVVSGYTLTERPEVARERAEGVVESMRRMGISEDIIDVEYHTGAQPSDTPYADGLTQSSRRRVDIEVFVE